MPFTAPLEIRKTGPEEWIVLREFEYLSDTLQITVPEGYRTDLASIPRAFRSLVSGRGYWDQPAVLHDFLVTDHVDAGTMSWKEAVGHMMDAMKDMEELWDVPWYHRRKNSIYGAVRAWGFIR